MSDEFLIVQNNTAISKMIPKQSSLQRKEEIAAIEERGKKIGSSASFLAGSSLAINLLMAGSLSLLWGLINSL